MSNMKHSCQFLYQIVDEQPGDISGIRKVNFEAFNNLGEVHLVDQLREFCDIFISLVAKADNKILGHILFTPVQIVSPDQVSITGLGLAPLSVLPEFQGYGIGSNLCRSGIKKIILLGYPFVVVVGNHGYYTRFGFTSAKRHNITCALKNIPEEAFLINIIDVEAMKDLSGIAYYRQEFSELN